MTATIHHQPRPEHLAHVLATRKVLGLGGSFRVVTPADPNRSPDEARKAVG